MKSSRYLDETMGWPAKAFGLLSEIQIREKTKAAFSAWIAQRYQTIDHAILASYISRENGPLCTGGKKEPFRV